MDARLQGYTSAWMQVEPRLEQAAEGVERRREQAAEDARSHPTKAGIPLPSFRRRPESSGFNNPFPQSGNDNPGMSYRSVQCRRT